MTHIVLFDDDPAKAALRVAHFDDHLAFLTANAGQIRSAGPLIATSTDATASTGEAVGGLWVVEGGSTEAIESLVAADPLYATGLRRSWRVQRWVTVFDRGQPTGLRPGPT